MKRALNPTNPVNRINSNITLTGGGAGARTLSRFGACALLLVFAAALSAVAATLTTDRPDYVPGQYVAFTGGGWQPGETVRIDIYETSVDPTFFEGAVSAIADADGDISNRDFQIQQSFLGQGFLANAAGESSGATASTTF